MQRRKPVLALVGRPNVGKSTLFNRLIGRRTAIVEDVPGTTRDRIYGDSYWNGVGFTVIDTGGLEAPNALGRQPGAIPLAVSSAPLVKFMQNQAKVAMDEADVIIMVVDGKEGMTAADQDVAVMLRASGKPIYLAANKTESATRQMDALEFWNLGIGEPYPISAYHGDGVGDLLDEVVKALPAYPDEDEEDESIGITIVGRPNVGKSSLLNALLGTERAIVSEIPGTTRDPIDTHLTFYGQTLTLIDTAGIRRRGSIEPGIEQYSVLRSMRSIDRADVVLLLIDAQDGVTSQDAHVAGYVLEKQKSVVVVVNKWDIIAKDEHTWLEFSRQVRADLKFMDYVPVLFISALTHQRVNQVLPMAMQVVEARRHRLSTSELNQLLREAYESTSPPNRQGRYLRIYYGTQIGNDPPTFVIFINDPEMIHFSYERFLENRVRAQYPFLGTPVKFIFRAKSDDQHDG